MSTHEEAAIAAREEALRLDHDLAVIDELLGRLSTKGGKWAYLAEMAKVIDVTFTSGNHFNAAVTLVPQGWAWIVRNVSKDFAVDGRFIACVAPLWRVYDEICLFGAPDPAAALAGAAMTAHRLRLTGHALWDKPEGWED